MNKYREMKLGQILATVNSKIVSNGSAVDVVTKDGSVVMTGSIDEIRERVAFNCHYHDDPIYGSRVRDDAKAYLGSTATPAQIESVVQHINEAIEREMPASHEKTREEFDAARSKKPEGVADRDKARGESTSARARKPDGVDRDKVRGGPAGVRAEKSVDEQKKLPTNRVGALQEMFHADDIIPRYEFKDTGATPVLPGEYHHCSVRLGHLFCWGKGLTKKAAKQDAAGAILLEIMRGGDPSKANKRSGRDRGGLKTFPDERMAHWEDLYLQKFDRYPRQSALGKPKKTVTAKYIMKDKIVRSMEAPRLTRDPDA